MSRNKLYTLLSAACAVGFIWLAITYSRSTWNEIDPGVCLFKRLTNVPCPSCGSTRSVLSLLQGDFWGALYWNPFGFILMAILVIAPLWILFDLVSRKATLFNFYTKAELFLNRKWVAITAVLIVLMNWIWNISKGI